MYLCDYFSIYTHTESLRCTPVTHIILSVSYITVEKKTGKRRKKEEKRERRGMGNRKRQRGSKQSTMKALRKQLRENQKDELRNKQKNNPINIIRPLINCQIVSKKT